MGKYQKNIEAARRISVMQYLETYHPGELVRKTDKEYCTKTHSSLVITPANGLFHWFSQSKGGNNALDYLVKVEGMDFVSAVRLLSAMTPMPVSIQAAKATPTRQHTIRPFELPAADRNTEAAVAYLMQRGISPKVLRYCVNSGILYQTTRGSYRNCVFVGKDENGVPRSAFQRGCQGSYRGDVAGSQKQYGFLIPAEIETCDTVEIYEAPIDAMSGATLRQYKHDSPWRSVHYLALGGLNHQPIDYFLQQHGRRAERGGRCPLRELYRRRCVRPQRHDHPQRNLRSRSYRLGQQRMQLLAEQSCPLCQHHQRQLYEHGCRLLVLLHRRGAVYLLDCHIQLKLLLVFIHKL